MKILFVNSVTKFKSGDLYLGTLSLASILKREGHDVDIIDFGYLCTKNIIGKKLFTHGDVKDSCTYITEKKPEIISFYTMANSFHTSINLAREVKKASPKTKIIFGGPQASVSAEKLLKLFPFIDVVGIGEGERSISKIINALKNEEGFSDIPGLAYRSETGIVVNKEPDLIEDLDTLPMLDFSFVPYIKEMSSLPIEVGRGCPFGCKYCSSKSFWKQKFRLKSNKRIISEMRWAIDNYGIKRFSFVHDLFTANKSRVLEFCRMIHEEKLDIVWACSARIDTLDEEVIKALADSGCEAMFVGVETGSTRMQKFANKNLKLDESFDRKIDLIIENKIQLIASFIYGFPGETEDDLKDTFARIENLYGRGVKTIQLHIFSMLRGTEFFNEYKDDIAFFPSLISDIAFGSIENDLDMIQEHPHLFSHFYTMKDSVVLTNKFCDIFLTHFLHIIRGMYSGTYNLLLQHFSNDLYKFYKTFYPLLEKYASKVFDYNNDISVHDLDYNDWLLEVWREFIVSHDFSGYDDLILQLFEFEMDINSVKFSSEDDKEIIKTYDFDLYDGKKALLSLDDFVQRETIIRISKPEGSIKLQKLRKKAS